LFLNNFIWGINFHDFCQKKYFSIDVIVLILIEVIYPDIKI